jgi:hypothetical protein
MYITRMFVYPAGLFLSIIRYVLLFLTKAHNLRAFLHRSYLSQVLSLLDSKQIRSCTDNLCL